MMILMNFTNAEIVSDIKAKTIGKRSARKIKIAEKTLTTKIKILKAKQAILNFPFEFYGPK